MVETTKEALERRLRPFVRGRLSVAIDKTPATRALRRWFERVAGRQGKKTAAVALARRLLVIAYRLLKDETVYDVKRLRRRAA